MGALDRLLAARRRDVDEADVVAADAEGHDRGVGVEGVELRRVRPDSTSCGAVMSLVCAPLQLGSRCLLTVNDGAAIDG